MLTRIDSLRGRRWKGKGKGRAPHVLARAQIPPSPFNAGHAGYCEASHPGSCNQPLSSTARFYAIPLDLIDFLKPPEHTHTQNLSPPPPLIWDRLSFIRMDRMKNWDNFNERLIMRESKAQAAIQPRPQGTFPWLWRLGAPPPKPGKSAIMACSSRKFWDVDALKYHF